MERALSPIQAYLNPAATTQQQHQQQQQPQTIKMEDVEQPAPAAGQTIIIPDPLDTFDSFAPSSPTAEPSKSSDQKPVKKRKSWGQVLPEPKTNLPPRKRAKTADEKEQRRIERVKRNRLAAHNSRERKRQEVEQLQTEKELLEHKLRQAQETMAKMAQQLQSLQEQTGIKVEPVIPSSTFDFTPSLTSETINPRQASTSSFESPALTMMSYDSSADSPMQPQTPINESSTQEPDPTQHSAAMLCDLQCRSGSSSHTTATRFHLAMNFFILLNIQLCTMTALSTIFSHSTRFRALLTRTKASSPPRSWLAWPNLLTTSPASIYLAALRVSSICTPTQAQHLLLATSMALQRVASSRSLSLRSDGGRSSVHSGFDQERYRQENMTRLWRTLTAAYESSSRGTNSAGIADDIKKSCEALDSILGKAETGRQKEFRRI